MKAVWKWQLPIEDRVEISMPQGARILVLQEQEGRPCLWALVDPETAIARYETRVFHVVGTGNHHDETWMQRIQYIGTVQQSIQRSDVAILAGAPSTLVWHVFEEPV